jgi:hypothetical protein
MRIGPKFCFSGEGGVAKGLRQVLIGDDDAALESEAADDASLIVIEFGGDAGPVLIELADFRQVGGASRPALTCNYFRELFGRELLIELS